MLPGHGKGRHAGERETVAPISDVSARLKSPSDLLAAKEVGDEKEQQLSGQGASLRARRSPKHKRRRARSDAPYRGPGSPSTFHELDLPMDLKNAFDGLRYSSVNISARSPMTRQLKGGCFRPV